LGRTRWSILTRLMSIVCIRQGLRNGRGNYSHYIVLMNTFGPLLWSLERELGSIRKSSAILGIDYSGFTGRWGIGGGRLCGKIGGRWGSKGRGISNELVLVCGPTWRHQASPPPLSVEQTWWKAELVWSGAVTHPQQPTMVKGVLDILRLQVITPPSGIYVVPNHDLHVLFETACFALTFF